MAEARSGTKQPSLTLQAGLNATPLKDFAVATRRSLIRNSFRLRNRVRDNLWPLSAWYLSMLMLFLTTLVIEETHCPAFLLLGFTYARSALNLDNSSDDIVHWSRPTQVVVCAAVCGVFVILALALVRQTALKCLLTWKGWLYSDPSKKKGSPGMLLWGLGVRLFSGPSPSLYSFQRCLPRLPVPPLPQTMSNYLKSMKPLLKEADFESLQVQAKEFERGPGVQLQRILWLKSWWASNYVSDWWEQYVYLMGRSSIALNSNYYALDQYDYLPTTDRTARAAGVIWLIANFYEQLEHEDMKPLRIQGLIPLCMEQYRRAMGTTRIPGREIDQSVHVDKAKHVVVFCNGSFFRLDVHDKKRQRLSPRDLQYQIQCIVQLAEEQADQKSKASGKLAALTGADRLTWFEARQALLQSKVNKESLTDIETAMMFVSLNAETPETLSERAHEAFHGDGTTVWFDKSFCLAVYGNGRVSMNVEHGWGDAPVIGHLMELTYPLEYTMAVYTREGHCADRCESDRIPLVKRKDQFKKPRLLQWDVPAHVQQTILDSYTTLRSAYNDTIFEMFVFNTYGKKFITSVGKCSPDSFVQMVIQAAYFRETGQFVLTYEAAMTRLFRNGRTETIRSVSDLSCQAVRAMESDHLSAKEKHSVLKEACLFHQRASRDAMSGHGVDRHMFALYVVCKGLGQESEFLKKALSFPWMLSTSQQPISQMASPAYSIDDLSIQHMIPLGGGFMSVADDGYGVSYNVVSKNRLQFHVSSMKKSLKKTDANRMAQHIRDVLTDWKSILEEATKQ